jgi:hypothetical protein
MRRRGWLLAALVIGGAAGAVEAASVRNPVNDSLLSMPKSRQVEMLADLAHHNCVGTDAFYMGQTTTGSARGTAYWSVACEDGHSYVIQINRDKKGTTFVADCRVLEGTGRACFEHF